MRRRQLMIKKWELLLNHKWRQLCRRRSGRAYREPQWIRLYLQLASGCDTPNSSLSPFQRNFERKHLGEPVVPKHYATEPLYHEETDTWTISPYQVNRNQWWPYRH